jgi:hypothetical protein
LSCATSEANIQPCSVIIRLATARFIASRVFAAYLRSSRRDSQTIRRRDPGGPRRARDRTTRVRPVRLTATTRSQKAPITRKYRWAVLDSNQRPWD